MLINNIEFQTIIESKEVTLDNIEMDNQSQVDGSIQGHLSNIHSDMEEIDQMFQDTDLDNIEQS